MQQRFQELLKQFRDDEDDVDDDTFCWIKKKRKETPNRSDRST